jgi:ABC-2 type transport system ATP-binding protein
MNTPPVIQVQNVSRRFGGKLALNDVSLEVPPGTVLGLVGANGAGKTTLIKHLLGLLRAKQGNVRVFGLDPVRHVVEVLGRIGYLSEDRDLPLWMTVGGLLHHSRCFYPRWDLAYAESLRKQFQLPETSVLRTLSKGELAKAGLIVALAHRPDLLVLDEASSGLDPVVRREILEALVRSVAVEGRTVVFSSHLLDEIARVSDHVAMMSGGRLVLHAPLATILESHRRYVVRLPQASAAAAGGLPGALSMTGGPEEWTVIVNGAAAGFQRTLREKRGEVLEETPATFEEIFHARAARREDLALEQQPQIQT